jgi:myosin-crossreactive antigen
MDCKNKELVGEERRKKKEEREKTLVANRSLFLQRSGLASFSAAVFLLFSKHLRYISLDLSFQFANF